ncbi:MAG TPA: acyl carrier protein [Burkholderiales bacterium]|nr:acyl carrier protein [Burkholderiales bacterium]
MTVEDIREAIVRIYVTLVPGGRRPREGERGELDSLAFLEFIVLIENKFGIVVETPDLDETNFATTESTAEYVRRKLDERQAA